MASASATATIVWAASSDVKAAYCMSMLSSTMVARACISPRSATAAVIANYLDSTNVMMSMMRRANMMDGAAIMTGASP